MLQGNGDDFWDCRSIHKELDKLVWASEEEVSDKLVKLCYRLDNKLECAKKIQRWHFIFAYFIGTDAMGVFR